MENEFVVSPLEVLHVSPRCKGSGNIGSQFYTTPMNPSSEPSPGNEDGCVTYSGPIRELRNLSSMKQDGKDE